MGAGIADTIDFGISGTITPTSALPEIFDNGTIIDAASQWIGIWPGGQPGITLDGRSAGVAAGFVINGASNCRIRGLLIIGFGGNAVEIANGARFNRVGGSQAGARNVISGNDSFGIIIAGVEASGNLVRGNFIGTDVPGSFDLGNAFSGVAIVDALNNTVGGSQAGARNVISGNDFDGIFISSFDVPASANGNVVQGNFIGTDVTGTADLGNTVNGVAIVDAPNNTVGGSQGGARNVISGNDLDGIFISGTDADGNVVQGNTIGTDLTRSMNLRNSFNGVSILFGARGNTIGGIESGEANMIAFNGLDGVEVGRSLEETDTGSNSIRGNAFFNNGSLGIDLGDDGPSANDDLDADGGPNNLQNYPVITSARMGSRRIAGDLKSRPSEEYFLDFYANGEVDESGFGEGERYLGSVTVMTDGSGQVSYDITLEEDLVFGEFITATATDSSGNTSEFFAAVVVIGETKPDDAAAFGGVPLGEHFFFSEWYGIYNITFFPWVFHIEHGWQFVFETDNPEAVFLFDLESQDFWWTTSAFQPLTFYSFNRGTFNFYFQGTSNPRSFVDLETQEFWFIPE